MKKTRRTAAAKASARARKSMNGAANDSAQESELTYGERLAVVYLNFAEGLDENDGIYSAAVIEALQDLATDDALEIMETASQALDYMKGEMQSNGVQPFAYQYATLVLKGFFERGMDNQLSQEIGVQTLDA